MFMTSLIYQSICLLSNNLFCLSITFCWIWERTTVAVSFHLSPFHLLCKLNGPGAPNPAKKSLCISMPDMCYLLLVNIAPSNIFTWKRILLEEVALLCTLPTSFASSGVRPTYNSMLTCL